MKQKLRYFIIGFIIVFILLFISNTFIVNDNKYAYAESLDTYVEFEDDEQVSTNGIHTALSLSINGGDNKVWTTAKNVVTILPSTVIVIVELYSSSEYTDNYEKMTLVAYNTTNDLDMGKTITAEAPTNDETLYWIGRMRYKIDNGSWQSKHTGVCKISGSGEFLGYI